MSTLALSRLPFWRWWRHRRWKVRRRPGAVVKPWNGCVLIAFLIALDLITKNSMTTLFPWHAQPKTWLVGPILITLLLLPTLFSVRFRNAGAFAISGALGNGISVAAWGAAANPFMYASGSDIVAFNLADAYIVVGFVLAIYGSLSLVIQLARRPA